MAALTPEGLGPALAVPGAAGGPAFKIYQGELLAPSPCPGQMVVLYNLIVHKVPRIRELFLHIDSPEFNRIRLALAKVKPRPRGAAARSFDALVDATGRALTAVVAAGVRGHDGHCGLPLPSQLV